MKIKPALDEVKNWFSAWELVSKKIYKINELKPVEFVFFDEKYIYSTSKVSINNGELIDGPGILGKKLVWKRSVHDGELKLPDGKVIPVGLVSFASPLKMDNQNSFFVMPLLEFWRSAGVESKELGLEKLITGVFLHEFSHTQQMQNFGAKISEYEQKYKFEVEFSDDVIQDYFEKDSLYNSVFRQEVKLFYDVAEVGDRSKSIDLTKQALENFKSRQNKYFIGNKEHFREIDEFFLTMEGLGQFTMYAWLIHPKGGNMSPEIALKGVRRGGKSWSQEEGLALFLVLDKLSKSKHWSKLMFGNKTESVIKLIETQIRKND